MAYQVDTKDDENFLAGGKVKYNRLSSKLHQFCLFVLCSLSNSTRLKKEEEKEKLKEEK